MAIRIRRVNGITVALCAAETDPHLDDLYLDDNIHHALSTKFGLDWESMGFIKNPPIDEETKKTMETQKLRDAEEELLKNFKLDKIKSKAKLIIQEYKENFGKIIKNNKDKDKDDNFEDYQSCCKSCGKPWIRHLGVEGTCKLLQKQLKKNRKLIKKIKNLEISIESLINI